MLSSRAGPVLGLRVEGLGCMVSDLGDEPRNSAVHPTRTLFAYDGEQRDSDGRTETETETQRKMEGRGSGGGACATPVRNVQTYRTMERRMN